MDKARSRTWGRAKYFCLFGVAAGSAAVAVACSEPSRSSQSGSVAAVLTHGPAVYEVNETTAIFWLRTDRPRTASIVVFAYDDQAEQSKQVAVATGGTLAANDNTGALSVAGLEPGTSYRYNVELFSGRTSRVIVGGTFRTAPAANAPAPVRFAFGGDVGGQNVCRDSVRGYPALKAVTRLKPDFFVALGDMIYADSKCEAVGAFGNQQIEGDFDVSATIEDFWAHWRYNRADQNSHGLGASTSSYALWDDHEVVNDFGPAHDTREEPPYKKGVALTPTGLRAFRDYNPVRGASEGVLYRSVRWGKNVELFFLDNRSYRDPNSATDDPAKPKTMLGEAQHDWLIRGLTTSNATWKLIVSSVPISIPTGSEEPMARDGWADLDSGQGFETELARILQSASLASTNLLFITTDVHFASVFRYAPLLDDNRRGPFVFHEAVVGPLAAGMFPNRIFDTSFSPSRLFFHGPDEPDSLDFRTAQTFMNFGLISVDPSGELRLSVIDATGREIYALELSPLYQTTPNVTP